MAKVWVEAHTRKDGVKVKAHYRDVPVQDKRSQKRYAALIRMGLDSDSALNSRQRGVKLREKADWDFLSGKSSTSENKRIYGKTKIKSGFNSLVRKKI